MGPSDGDEPGGWCRVEPGGWVRRRRRAEPLDRDRLVERVLALATKRSADARRARDALRAFRAALGTRDEANRARMASREPATALLAARADHQASRVWTRGPEGGRAAAPRRRERHRRRGKKSRRRFGKPERSLESPSGERRARGAFVPGGPRRRGGGAPDRHGVQVQAREGRAAVPERVGRRRRPREETKRARRREPPSETKTKNRRRRTTSRSARSTAPFLRGRSRVSGASSRRTRRSGRSTGTTRTDAASSATRTT